MATSGHAGCATSYPAEADPQQIYNNNTTNSMTNNNDQEQLHSHHQLQSNFGPPARPGFIEGETIEYERAGSSSSLYRVGRSLSGGQGSGPRVLQPEMALQSPDLTPHDRGGGGDEQPQRLEHRLAGLSI